MKDKGLVRSYISNFRRHLSPYLRPGLGLKCTGILAKSGGGVLKIAFSKNAENSDEIYRSVESVPEAISQLGLKAFGNAQGIIFSGTNTVLESNAIYLIKGEERDLWSDAAAKEDVSKILHSPKGARG